MVWNRNAFITTALDNGIRKVKNKKPEVPN
jgi:hypothetical protein